MGVPRLSQQAPGETRVRVREERSGQPGVEAITNDTGRSTSVVPLRISVVIPAYNETKYLEPTVAALQNAIAASDATVEVIVVDNRSTDETAAALASRLGCRVVPSGATSIGGVRNDGARAASHEHLFFLDADTIVPCQVIVRICQAFADGHLGGGFIGDYRPARPALRCYHRLWGFYADARDMVQGFAQFCTADAFRALEGYDTTLFMGEDNDFFWRLRKLARSAGTDVTVPADLRVLPSCRRVDDWSVCKTIFWTNPLTVSLFRRSRRFWSRWYGNRTVR